MLYDAEAGGGLHFSGLGNKELKGFIHLFLYTLIFN